MTLFHLKLYEAIRNNTLQTFDTNGYFPRDQEGNPVVVNGDNDESITIGYIQNGKRKSIRLWEKQDPARTLQYTEAAALLSQYPSRFFQPFRFLEKGIMLEQQPLDILVTDWTNHKTFKEYIFQYLGQPEKLLAIADEYARMQTELAQSGLQQFYYGLDSIIVTSDLKLLINNYHFQKAGQSSKANGFCRDSYATALTIYISIKALSIKPHLWDRYLLSNTKELLFKTTDLSNLTHSAIYLNLKGISEEIDHLLHILTDYCDKNTVSDWLLEVRNSPASHLPASKGSVQIAAITKPAVSSDLPEAILAEKTQIENRHLTDGPSAPPVSHIAKPAQKIKVITDGSIYDSAATTGQVVQTSKSNRKLYSKGACAVLLLTVGGLLLNKLSKNSATPASDLVVRNEIHSFTPPSSVKAGATKAISTDTAAIRQMSSNPLPPANIPDVADKIQPATNIEQAGKKEAETESLVTVPATGSTYKSKHVNDVAGATADAEAANNKPEQIPATRYSIQTTLSRSATTHRKNKPEAFRISKTP